MVGEENAQHDASQQSEAFSFEDASQLNISAGHMPISIHTETDAPGFAQTVVGAQSYTQDNVRVVWGTTINIQETIENFKEFVRTFVLETALHGDENVPRENKRRAVARRPYMDKMEEMHEIDNHVVELDFLHLEPKFAKIKTEIKNYPVETLPLLEMAFVELYMEKYPESRPSIKIVLRNVRSEREIKDLGPAEIDKLVEIRGMVSKTSNVKPDLVSAQYECSRCKKTLISEVIRGVVAEPVECTCGSKFSMVLDSEESRFIDKQIIKIQEIPEYVSAGSVPSTITVIATGLFIDELAPGDRVKVSGIYKAVPLRLNYIHRTIKSTFRTYVEMVSYEKERKKSLSTSEEIESLRKTKGIYEILANSVAPSIYGHMNVKKALLLQLLGGVQKNLDGARFRGDINVLLAGDPGVSKSQFLVRVHKLADRGIYTSGKGSTSVGLTASVSKDTDTGQYILEPGALVISDGGVCCIDEFDKMGEATRSVLHEAMEQQTVSVAKAGIITTLNARCSILAGCNPLESRYNPRKNILENLGIPPTLLSRFDIVCLMLDKCDTERDRKICEHIIDLYGKPEEVREEDPHEEQKISDALLKKYIQEGRRIIPQITEEASTKMRGCYVELRQLGNGVRVSATTRQLENIIRLSEAHARMRLSHFVEREDVEEAIRLIKESLHLYAVDPISGRIDMELLYTGRSASSIKMEEDLKGEIVRNIGSGIDLAVLASRMAERGAAGKLFREALSELEEEGRVLIEKNRVIKTQL
jgi:DNA replication licensing factor MCM4